MVFMRMCQDYCIYLQVSLLKITNFRQQAANSKPALLRKHHARIYDDRVLGALNYHQIESDFTQSA